MTIYYNEKCEIRTDDRFSKRIELPTMQWRIGGGGRWRPPYFGQAKPIV